MINVSKPFLPPIEDYIFYIKKVYETNIVTNQGPLLQELETKLKQYLQSKYLHILNNGTIALQLALDALDVKNGEVITTPFSYVATVSSILWERCNPIFVDIEADNFTIDVSKIEEKITKNTKAIMVVHVFGYACDVEAIEKIAKKYNLKVIYDAAHAFGVKYKEQSLLNWGDISTLSFHATKLFHTGEGGACICNDDNINKKLDLNKRFGHYGDDHHILGINGKNSELNIAMGLAVFKHLDSIIAERKEICETYDNLLKPLIYNKTITRPKVQANLTYNYAYYPIIFKTEQQLLKTINELKNNNIFARRYFYPSLNTLSYLPNKINCLVSEDISTRILCLPLYNKLNLNDVNNIANILIKSI
jgi:dTDP-4-amino-4,6-dideoxygalactose transaminase